MVDRTRKVRQVLAWILAANWAVALAKLWIGISSHAAAVTADGVHGFIDGASNVIGLVALSIAAQPADEDHPYGHGKFEALASLGIGIMVGIGMLELGKMALASLLHNEHPRVDTPMFAVMVGTLAVNLVVTNVERRIGQTLKSPILIADASHTLSDVFVTIAVLGSLVLIKLGYPRADGVTALLVMAMVALVAYQIIRQAVGILSDSARLPPFKVAEIANAVEGVQRCTSVRSRGMESAVYVDLKIEVEPHLPISVAHSLSHEVEARLMGQFPEIVDVVVHVEPGEQPGAGSRSAPRPS